MDGHNDSEDILQAVLSQAFSPPPSRRQSVATDVVAESPSSSSANVPSATPEPAQESSEHSDSSDDSWKAEYESQVEAWRAQSSEARKKAKKERRRWEAIRAAEKEGAQRRQRMGIPDDPLTPEPRTPDTTEHPIEWETVSNAPTHTLTEASEMPSPSPADSKDPVDESAKQHTIPPSTGATTGIPSIHSQAETADESQKWEDIQSSVTSSFPSMSFPERTETPSPSRQHPTPPLPAPPSATLAIFDSTLTTRTRVTALFTSLAINMLLPFVNGVMLGFGEIFAKNVVMEWFGWKASGPGSVAANTGIGASTKTPWGQRQKQKQS
ncbi:hypothetical protein Hypma_006493 [Hypsizygus marmoreus]|uniref:Mitochondrial import protein 1 n=1 Tax=Hypsizygus marmoreus TaxID=39966 RepID=A0A369JU92_HYPMA|nr:hypothetical protein Hypma_006493 [Hypsizygus marmoreus]